MTDWLPDTEHGLRDLLSQGLLVERHTLDVKRALPPGRPANKELAKDLAQFAPDGGVLVYGLDEGDATTPPRLTPVELAGLRERIDQVAATLIEEPLHVRIQEIPTANNSTKGYLLVVVPPSPSKIHMVDGRYWGRGDTTRHQLSDAEVQRYHQLALRAQRDAAELLDAEVARDPVPAEQRTHAHLTGIAQPVAGRPDLLERVLGTSEDGWSRFFHGQVRGGPAGRPLGNDWSPDGWSPDLPQLSNISRRAAGWALSSPGIEPGREVVLTPPTRTEGRLLDLEVNEDGSLHLFCGRASDRLRAWRDEEVECVFETVIIGLTKRLVLVAQVVADTTGYLGSWDVGIAVTGLRG
jgi:hypothetical protein